MREIIYISSTRKDLLKMPEKIREVFSVGLLQASMGLKHVDAVPLKGYDFKGKRS